MITCRILVALDGSVTAEAMLPEVERIAVGESEVHFLHIVPSFPEAVGAVSARVMECHDRALAYLEEVRGRFPSLLGLDLIRTGDPADAILQVVLELNIDLVALPTARRTGLAKWFESNVAEDVVRKTQLPVLLARPGMAAPHPVLRRILVPLYDSETSFTILTEVKRLALRTGATVVLLNVTERALAPVATRRGVERPEMPVDPAEHLLTITDDLEKSGLVSWKVSAEGDAVEEILSQAKTLDADVIAMSTHARSRRDRSPFGSVAHTVLGRADRAILLQKPVVRGSVEGSWRNQ